VLELSPERFEPLLLEAKASPRRRAHWPLHRSHADAVQRLVVGILPQSYVVPHRHCRAEGWELLVVLRGRINIVVFDDAGCVERIVPASHTAAAGVQLPAYCWHAIVALEPSIFMEVKAGPYVPEGAAEFAPWAPNGDPALDEAYCDWLTHDARPGHCFPDASS